MKYYRVTDILNALNETEAVIDLVIKAEGVNPITDTAKATIRTIRKKLNAMMALPASGWMAKEIMEVKENEL